MAYNLHVCRHAMCVACLVVLAIFGVGCSSEREPPTKPSTIDTARFSDSEFRIGGQDPVAKELVLQAGETYPIEGQYHPRDGEYRMLLIELLIDSNGVPTVIANATVSDPTLTKDGLVKFNTPFQMPSETGRFELRVETGRADGYVVMSETIRLEGAP